MAEKSVLTDKKTYMEECEDLTDDADTCEDLWKERDGIVLKGAIETVTSHVPDTKAVKEAIKNVKLLDVDNVEYKERRAAALKKPNAVVIQTTFSDNDR